MTFDFIRTAWDTPCQTHTQKLVLAALAVYADKSGKCWPSIQALCKRCNLSERALYAQISLLKAAGLVSVKSGGGKHRVNTYQLHLGNPAPDSVNGKHCMGNTECRATNPAPRAENPARRAPQLPGTAKELPRGGPPKTVNEVEKQIHRQTEAMEKFRYDHTDGGNKWTLPGALEEYRKMKQRKEALENELRNM